MPTSPFRRVLVPSLAGVASVALLLGGTMTASADPALPVYTTVASQFGTATTDPWTVSGDASVVADVAAGNDVLQLAVDPAGSSSIMHNFPSNTYPGIDNVWTTGLPALNIFSGATNGQIDPATGLELQPAVEDATFEVRSEAGDATLFLDFEVAYGDDESSLETVVLTCELPVSTAWSLVDVNDCSSLAQTVNNPNDAMNWMPTTDWTFAPNWGGAPVTFPAGGYVKAGWSPEILIGSAFGFRIVGDASPSSIRIDQVTVRDHVIAFLTDWPAAAATPATDTELLQYLEDNSIPVEPIATGEVDPGKDLPVDVAWTGQPGELVDMYVYSTPKALGSVAATGGTVSTTVSLAGLPAGSHTIVLVGRLSGTTQAYSVSVAALLAETGSTPVPAGLLGGAVLLLGAAALTFAAVRRRTTAHAQAHS